MSVDLRCNECGDNFGKDKENPKVVGCECGNTIENDEGYSDEDEEEEEEEEESIPYKFWHY